MTETHYISVLRAAQLAGVHPDTVRRRIADGTLKAVLTHPGGSYRIDVDSFNWWLTPAKSKETA